MKVNVKVKVEVKAEVKVEVKVKGSHPSNALLFLLKAGSEGRSELENCLAEKWRGLSGKTVTDCVSSFLSTHNISFSSLG